MKKIFSIFVLSILFVGCTTVKEVVKEVPVEVIREVEKNIYVHDSIYMHDSTFIYQKGDTVFLNKWKTKYVEKQIHDTLRTHDTIPKIINTETTVTKTVNKPQWWPVWLCLGIVCAVILVTKTDIVKYIKDFISYIIKLFKK